MLALEGVRVLVVEDDTFILMDMESLLGEAGAEIAGLCRSVEEALPIVEREELDVAILDFGLGNETAAPIARSLVSRGKPFCFYTGQVANDSRLAAWRNHKIIQKPAQPNTIITILRSLLACESDFKMEQGGDIGQT
jgi:DNA-binding response OmpR family regulator